MQKLSINLTEGDLAAVDRIASRFVMARRHAVARAALRAGVDQMARDTEFARQQLLREATGAVDGGLK